MGLNVERLKSFKDLEMEGLVHCGRCSPVIRFTPLYSVFATTGFIYKGAKLLANGLKFSSGKLKLNKQIKLRVRHSRACGNLNASFRFPIKFGMTTYLKVICSKMLMVRRLGFLKQIFLEINLFSGT
jgi:hypothetical protein